MPLAPGTNLGPFEIQSPLGAGGMGEVYRAKDRDVAIKVLPEALAKDAERLRRFTTEAWAIAALITPTFFPFTTSAPTTTRRSSSPSAWWTECISRTEVRPTRMASIYPVSR